MCIAQVDTVQQSAADVLAAIFVEAERIEQAREILSMLPDKQAREHVREMIAETLVKTGQIAEAQKMIDEMVNTRSKEHLIQSIALAQMRADQVEQARATANTLAQGEKRSNTLKSLVEICCQTHRWDLARNIAGEIPPGSVRREALRLMAVDLARAGEIRAATNIARSIDNPYSKNRTLCDLATILAQKGDIKGAQNLASTIKNNPNIQKKVNCNTYLASMFGATMAEKIALGMGTCIERDEALYEVTSAYACKQEWEKAEKLAKEIADEQKQSEVWEMLTRELTQAGLWTQAIAAFDNIQKDNQRLSILQVWGTLLAQPANRQIREQIVQHLHNSREKASLLTGIADELAQAGHYLEQVHLIQQVWLQISTKDDCGYLFAMVRGLLSRNPEMSREFWESFAWVESFLER